MKTPKPIMLINICGALGYMFLLAVWTLFAAALLGVAFDAIEVSSSKEVIEIVDTPQGEASSPPAIVVSYVFAAVLGLVSIGVVVTAPYLIGKWGSRLVRGLMRLAKVDRTHGQVFLVKGLLAALPLLGLLLIHFLRMPEAITFAALYVACVGLAIISLVCFLVQLFLARRFNIPVDEVW